MCDCTDLANAVDLSFAALQEEGSEGCGVRGLSGQQLTHSHTALHAQDASAITIIILTFNKNKSLFYVHKLTHTAVK